MYGTQTNANGNDTIVVAPTAAATSSGGAATISSARHPANDVICETVLCSAADAPAMCAVRAPVSHYGLQERHRRRCGIDVIMCGVHDDRSLANQGGQIILGDNGVVHAGTGSRDVYSSFRDYISASVDTITGGAAG